MLKNLNLILHNLPVKLFMMLIWLIKIKQTIVIHNNKNNKSLNLKNKSNKNHKL
jgi:hypothetical protein